MVCKKMRGRYEIAASHDIYPGTPESSRASGALRRAIRGARRAAARTPQFREDASDQPPAVAELNRSCPFLICCVDRISAATTCRDLLSELAI